MTSSMKTCSLKLTHLVRNNTSLNTVLLLVIIVGLLLLHTVFLSAAFTRVLGSACVFFPDFFMIFMFTV